VSSSPIDGLLDVGRIGRAHGIQGAVVVTLATDRTERVAVGARLHDGHHWRIVAASRLRQPGTWVVTFDDVADRTLAETLTGRTLWAEPIDDPDALWVHDLIGRDVVDLDGIVRGRCAAVLDNPAHDLLELDTGHLVPVVFVTGIVDDVIRIAPPDGLFDLT
jgi:16S rRNA processing protein RimM